MARKLINTSLQTTKGKLQMTFDKFNVEYASNCKKKDYLFVGSLAKYTSVSRLWFRLTLIGHFPRFGSVEAPFLRSSS